ncbi:MAG: hypothetical protein WKI04_18120, partial [Ferruginibacter sp.]
MTHLKGQLCFALTIITSSIAAFSLNAQKNLPLPAFKIYAGSTHAHTAYTWSHGSQYDNAKEAGILIDSQNVAHPRNRTPKNDWRKFQGFPPDHYAAAKASGYDFYVTTDHSQEEAFYPTNPNNEAWLATNKAANEASDGKFVPLVGFEFSENNGPGGKGHLNVINSSAYLNALETGVDLPHFYKWLQSVPPNSDGPVVATFNHPAATQYNNWAHRDAKVTTIVTMLEIINSNKNIHHEGFVKALDAGWKVSPVAGNDNHGLGGIKAQTSRTFVLATTRTKAAILDAMKNRRTYASLDKNIQCRYNVNGKIMGSTLNGGKDFKFEIVINDPDTNNPKNKITKIDIVKDGGEVVQTYNPTPAYSIKWSPTITNSNNQYFFVRVWNAGGGDAPKA